jgi:fructose-1-phosphate kinase PfkB-like protein
LRGLGRLSELGAGAVSITLPEGHSYLDVGEGAIWALAPTVEAVSTIGSGDAYLAGLLAGLLHRRLSAADAARLAAGCAAANAETLGAGLFDPRRAEDLAEQVRVEVLSELSEKGRV